MLTRLVPLTAVLLALTLLFAACSDNNGKSDQYGDNTPGASSATNTPSASNGGTPVGSFADNCQKTGERQFSAAPPQIIDPSKTYTATISTDKGDIVLELFSDVPGHTNNFAFLACKGFYDGLSFHRVIAGFVAQGGDPKGDCTGGPGYTIPDEDSAGHKMDAGVISMAKSGPNTTGSQFFITYTPQPQLESAFTVFGKVTSGMDVLAQLTPRECAPGAAPGDTINSITIEEG